MVELQGTIDTGDAAASGRRGWRSWPRAAPDVVSGRPRVPGGGFDIEPTGDPYALVAT